MPPSRTFKYSIFRACERFHINPFNWEDMNIAQQADLLAYSQVRELEENNTATMLLKGMSCRP